MCPGTGDCHDILYLHPEHPLVAFPPRHQHGAVPGAPGPSLVALGTGRAEMGQSPPDPINLAGFLSFQPPQLWKICSSLSWENATWEMPLLTHPSARGVLPVTVSSYFRKGDGNKWKDKVPLV